MRDDRHFRHANLASAIRSAACRKFRFFEWTSLAQSLDAFFPFALFESLPLDLTGQTAKIQRTAKPLQVSVAICDDLRPKSLSTIFGNCKQANL